MMDGRTPLEVHKLQKKMTESQKCLKESWAYKIVALFFVILLLNQFSALVLLTFSTITITFITLSVFQMYALLPMSIVNQAIMISDMPLSVSMSHCERHRQAEHLIHKQWRCYCFIPSGVREPICVRDCRQKCQHYLAKYSKYFTKGNLKKKTFHCKREIVLTNPAAQVSHNNHMQPQKGKDRYIRVYKAMRGQKNNTHELILY